MSSNNDLFDVDLEFALVCVHTVLFSRNIYPTSIFEQKRYLGITVWQSKHPEVNEYVSKVLHNAQPLFLEGLVDRFVIAIDDPDNKPLEHITIKLSRERMGPMTDLIHEEYRSTILRLGMLDRQSTRLPEDYSWKLMVVTKVPSTSSNQNLMHKALTDGNWFVDNNKLSEQLALAHRVSLCYLKLN